MSAVAGTAECRQLTETTLGALAEYITSGSRDWSKYYAASGAMFIRTQDINQNRLALDDVARVQLPSKVEGKRSLVRKGDLLITITGANVGKVAVVARQLPEAYVSQSVCLVRLKDPSLAKFLQLQLIARRGKKSALEAMAYGLGRPVLNLENVRAAPVRTGPPSVMAEIVAELEKQFSRLDEAVANLKRVKVNLTRYEKAVLRSIIVGESNQHLDRSNLPPGWELTALPDLGELSRGKSRHRPRDDHRLYGGPYPFVQTGDVRHSGGLIRQYTQTYSEFGLSQSRLWPEGTLCITIAANIAETGILAMPACFPDSVVGFLSDDRVLTRFVELFMRTAREELQRFAPATAQKNINLAVLERVLVPLPPAAERERIVAEIDRRLSIVREVEVELESNLSRARTLQQVLLGKNLGIPPKCLEEA